jgi:hypothetical protein
MSYQAPMSCRNYRGVQLHSEHPLLPERLMAKSGRRKILSSHEPPINLTPVTV